MQKDSGQLLFSASDIINFLACRPLTALDFVNLDTQIPVAEDDPTAKLLQEKGFAHESAFLKRLRNEGRRIVEIPEQSELKERAQLTIAAMEDGADVIFQAAFLGPPWVGYADFLLRADVPSGLGKFSYEVYDTKLARKASPRFLVQLGFYNQLLAAVQGRLGERVHVILGNDARESFYSTEIDGYVSMAKERFLDHVKGLEGLAGLEPVWRHAAVPYPVPCEKCDMCRWREICDKKRLGDDYLSQVANIRKTQIAKLEAVGIKTMTSLAALHNGAPARIPGMEKSIQKKLAHQAFLQQEEKNTGKQRYDLLPPFDQLTRVEPLEYGGLSTLPRPDTGDMFFDMEGNPLEEGGLEYLFGVVFKDGGKEINFKPFWAHTRAEEKIAFEEFVDFALARLRQFPQAHIYHYASYEVSAMRRLASRHATRELEVDDLLRRELFVDLYRVVRESLLLSKDSYSIKMVEEFYRDKRAGDVKKGDQSIVVYEEWKASQNKELLKSIEDYNREDCISTSELRDWLIKIAPEWIPAKSAGSAAATAAPDEVARPRSESALREEAERTALETALRPFATGASTSPIADSSVFELTAQLLAFHLREKKPGWWSLFDRQGAELEDLLEDEEIVAACEVLGPASVESGIGVRFQFPEQEFRIQKGDGIKILSSPLNGGEVSGIDEEHGTIDVAFRKQTPLQPIEHLVLHSDIPTSTLGKAITRFAQTLIAGKPKYKALLDFLNRRHPDVRGITPGNDLLAGKPATVENIWQVVEQMNESTLYIQGPPGAGKTFSGAHLIARLIRAGKKVAVCSNSHKAVNHLMGEAHDRLVESKHPHVAMKKFSSDEHKSDRPGIINVKDDKKIIAAIAGVQLVGGVAWTFCKEDLDCAFDYLFVDEAGQVSLANLIAMGVCARNIVLLGDQMQLGQPIQASHPGRSGESALDYLLDSAATIPSERGIFLDKTFRMHPDLCGFVSDCFYEGRLQPDVRTTKQRLLLAGGHHAALRTTGLVLHLVDHQDNSQRSPEEATEIKNLIGDLLKHRFVDHEGLERPLTIGDVLVVAPYNAQVGLLAKTLPAGSRVGTVDKFQGQEAQVVIVSMSSSSIDDSPRGMEFLLNRNRLNVAVSRGKCLSILVCSPRLLESAARTPEDVARLNVLGRAKMGKP